MSPRVTLRQKLRHGMFAVVRNRRGVIAEVQPTDDAKGGRLHLVHFEYKDDQLPHKERRIWEVERLGRLLEPNALPDAGGDPMPADDFDSLVRAARWTSASPFLDPDGKGATARRQFFQGGLTNRTKEFSFSGIAELLAADHGLSRPQGGGLDNCLRSI